MLTQSIQDDPTMLDTPGDPKLLTGDNPYGFLFAVTARGSSATFGVDLVKRFGGKIWVKGYSERVTMETDTLATSGVLARNWLWRRIVFATKGRQIRDGFPAATLEFSAGSEGHVRPLWNFLGTDPDAGPAREAVESLLFQGTIGEDWNDRFSAKVSRQRVTLLSDVTRKLNSGNTAGSFHHFKTWYPVHKNVVYDQIEDGDTKNDSMWSVTGKPGIGDVYVYDTFACAGGTSDDELFLQTSGTFYWHER